MQRGLFITFEGGEGSGKSSHIKALKEHFEGLGRRCVLTREPGGTPLSEKIRELLLHAKEGDSMTPLTELLLFSAARAQHVEELIAPALERGDVVISDRFMDSSTAYQGAARALDADLVGCLNKIATGGLMPDITILLDVPVELGLQRAKNRDCGAADRMGSQELDFYRAVRAAFLELARGNPRRFCVVSTEGPKEEAFAEILKFVKGKLAQ